MAMELRRAPTGVDEHATRGAQNFVRLLNGSKVLAAVNDFAFALDPGGGVTSCVPFHINEGFYARMVENSADVAMVDIQFDHSRLDICIVLAAEASLSLDFGTSPCSVDEFVRRVEVEAARRDRTAIRAYARHYVSLEPFLLGENLDDVWVSALETATLVDSGGCLAPYADLDFLMGPRSLRLARLLCTPLRYSSAMFRLGNAVCLWDGGIVVPAARLVIPGVPAVPAIAGHRGRGRGAGAAPAAPAVPGVLAAPLPSSLFDGDIRLGLGDWLRAFALPIELSKLPLSNRDVRSEVQAGQDFADDARHEHVIRARFTTMIAALPALLSIVSGVSLTVQLELIQRLALALTPGTFDYRQAASYRALGGSAGDYVHVLSTGGGATCMPTSERAKRVLGEHLAAEERRRSAPVAHSADAGGGSSSSAGASEGGGGTAKAPAFLKVNSAALERFVAAHSAKFLADVNTPESAAFVDAGLAGPLGDRDAKRILRIAFQREWGVAYLQFMQTTRPCGHVGMKCSTVPSHSSTICTRTSRRRSLRTMTGPSMATCVRIWRIPAWSTSSLTGASGTSWICLRLSKGASASSVAVRLGLAKPRRGLTVFSVTTLCCARCSTMATLFSAQLDTDGAVRLDITDVCSTSSRSTLISTVTMPTIRPLNSMIFIRSSCALQRALIAPLWSPTPRQRFRCSQSKLHRGMVVWLSCASRRSGAPPTPSGVARLAR